jgi:hypothetical protein
VSSSCNNRSTLSAGRRHVVVDGGDGVVGEFHVLHLRTVLFEPCVVRVAHDREQPRARVAAVKAGIKPERAQTCLLHDVFGVALVAREPAREVVGRIEMRHHGFLESRLRFHRFQGY